MPLLTATSYDPTLKTVTIQGDIASASLTSIVNQTRGRQLFVAGQTPITNRVFSEGSTTFTLNTDSTGDSASDVLAVRYKAINIITSLADGTIINDVAHFVRDTPPTTRINGSALVNGDLWYKPVPNGIVGTSGNWIYRVVQSSPLVAYWVTAHTAELGFNTGNSAVTYSLSNGAVFGSGANTNPSAYMPPFGYNNLIFLNTWTVRQYSSITSTLDASNKFDLHEGLSGASGFYIATIDNLSKLKDSSGTLYGTKSSYYVGKAISTAVNTALGLNLFVQNVVGSPVLTSARLAWSYSVRGIHP